MIENCKNKLYNKINKIGKQDLFLQNKLINNQYTFYSNQEEYNNLNKDFIEILPTLNENKIYEIDSELRERNQFIKLIIWTSFALGLAIGSFKLLKNN